MKCFLKQESRRRGATVPLFAILLVPLMGMLAFSIDLGYIALVKTDLQTAADAAALAGAEKLQELYVQYTLPGQTNQSQILNYATTNSPGSPMATAERFASYNKAGNVSITVRDPDVSFSFMDASGTFHSNYWNQGSSGGFPNSISVIARRDGIQNSPVSLFFGPIFGFYTKNLEATATATIYSGEVTSLRVMPQGITSPHILPVALDMNIWKKFYDTGLSPDGQIHLAADGSPQLYVYGLGPWDPAGSTNTPGSFGLIDVRPPATNSPAFKAWIDNGQTPNDINYLLNNGMLPVSINDPKQWNCGTGLKSTLQPDFYSQMGVPSLIPLFSPYNVPTSSSPFYAPYLSGFQAQNYDLQSLPKNQYTAASAGGSGATYAIVGFAGVSISQADATGSNMSISIQPCAVVDPTAYIQNPRPAGTQVSQFGATINNPVITTFISAKLTQ